MKHSIVPWDAASKQPNAGISSPAANTWILSRPPLISSTILPRCWAEPCKTSSAGVQLVDIRHWNLGCAMTFGASIAAVAPAAATTPPAFTRNLRRSIRSPNRQSEIGRQTGREDSTPSATTWLSVGGPERGRDVSGEERRSGSAQHGGTPHFLVEERHDGTDPAVELLPDRLHVVVLHAHAVQDELGHVRAEGLAVYHHVDDHAPDRDPELVEPADEARDDRDREGLRQGDEEERGLAVVGEQPPRLTHPFPEPQQVLEERVRLLLPTEGQHLAQGPRLLAGLEHLVHPEGVDLRHAEQPPGVGGRRRVEHVDLVVALQHHLDHVLEHRRLLEGRVHRRRLDEIVGFGRDVRELEEPLDLLADLLLGALDRVPGVDLVGPEVGDAGDGGVTARDVLA